MIEKQIIKYLQKRGYKIYADLENPPKPKRKVEFLPDLNEEQLVELETPRLSKFLKQFKRGN